MGKIASILTLASLVLAACDDAPTPGPGDAATARDARSVDANEPDGGAPEPEPGSLLVTPETLDPSAAVLDVRSAEAFLEAHLPGALSLPETRLRTTVDGVPGQLPPLPEVAHLLSDAGIPPGAPLVVVGHQSDLGAARVLWTLERMGHADVRLLDGGIAAWREAGQATLGGQAATAATAYSADRHDPSRVVDAAWVQAHLSSPDVALIDARSAAEYARGHIPGALSHDWQESVTADGRLKPDADLQALHADVPDGATLVTYCQTGSRAAMAYLVLRQLGYPDVRLYDGSWAEWSRDPQRPVDAKQKRRPGDGSRGLP